MFKLAQSDSYSWPVKISIPADGGKYLEQSFDAVFKRVPQSKIKEMLESETMTDIDFCKEVLVGWKGITGDNQADVPFSDEARDKLLDVPAVATATVEAYIHSIKGAAKRKN